MSQLKIELREPSPDDYRKASMKDQQKHEVEGDVKTSNLSEEEVFRLYKRADDIEEKEEDEKEFFKREKSVKPPRTGDIVKESFPPPVSLEKPDELLKEEEEIRKELKVIRYMPEGEDFDVCPQVLITFNQPMVPLTSVDDLKKYPVPVKMFPEVEGEWRWVGTKTVKWKPTYRLPKSTIFEIIVPKGVNSEWGCEFKEDFSFKFSTVALKMDRMTPCMNYGQKVGEGAPVIVEFNQKINQEEIMKFIRMNTRGNLMPMKLEEVKEFIDSGVMKKKLPTIYNAYNNRIKNVLPERWVCFRSENPLPLNTRFTVSIPAGTPSEEGPRLTTKNQSKQFETYGPFIKTTHHPDQDSDIVPNQGFSISFSNNIELDDFDAERDVKIEPPLPRAVITPSRNIISISGQSKGNTHYMVTINKSMIDIYGQNLKDEVTIEFAVGRARQNMYGFFNNRMIVHDMCMSKTPEFEIVSINLSKIHVIIRQVSPLEYHRSSMGSDYNSFRGNWGYQKPLTIDQQINCGKDEVFNEDIEIEDKPDELILTKIDLTKYLQHVDERCGQLYIYVEPSKDSWTKNEFRYAPRIKTWVQVTHLAVDGISSHGGEIYGFCSKLEDGRGIPNTTFSLCHRNNNNSEDYESKIISKIGDEDGTVFISGLYSYGSLLIAKHGNDTCFVTNLNFNARPNDRYLSYIVNDRNLYKPKEIVSIKGILRYMTHGTWDRHLKIPEIKDVKWICYDPRGSKLKEGIIKTNKFGSFFVEIELPDNINLGDGRVTFEYDGNSINVFHHTFKIQEFRTPEFKSNASVENNIPYFPNGVAIVNGSAEYFSGGGLSGCDVTWKIKQSETVFYPPNFSFQGFNFNCGYKPLLSSSSSSSSLPSSIQPFSSSFGGLDLVSILEEGQQQEEQEKKFEGKTDGSGDHKLCVEFLENKEVKIKKPTVISCDLNIQDINRQVMSSSTSFTVHPSKYYVGIKKKKYFARKGEVLPMDLIVTDLEGTLIPNIDIEMTIFNRFWERKGYNWKQLEIEVGGKGIKFNSKKQPIPCDIKLEQGGTFYFVCKIKDEEGRENYCSTTIWVAGGKEKTGGGSRIEEEVVKLIGNKTEYEADEEAKILVSSPFSPAEGLMVLICNGFVVKERFRILEDEDSKLLTIPIRKEYVPGVTIQVFLSGNNYRIDENTGRPSSAAPIRPAFAKGTLSILVPPKKFTLEVNVTPDKSIMKPGESGNILIEVIKNQEKEEDKDDEEVAVSLIIVDEAVLSLTGYNLPHPINNFTPSNGQIVNVEFFRKHVVLKDWSSIVCEAPPKPILPLIRPCCAFSGCHGGDWGGCELQSKCNCLCDSSECFDCPCCMAFEDCCDCDPAGPPCDAGGEAPQQIEEESVIEVRTDFRPLAIFLSDAILKDGKTIIPFTLPDNLTKYRVWVLAHSLNNTSSFGLGESYIQAQLPVAIRPSLPRFLNYGDRCDFTVIVQNQTLDTIQVKLAVRMTNLRLTDNNSKGVLVEIPIHQRAELRFPVITHKCGIGRFQVIGAVAGTNFADAVEKELPIFTPSTSEAFATYGEIDKDNGTVIQSVIPPEEVYNQFGGLSITTSSTALQSLTDAFLYLYNYKFDCVEQISSRMLSINALKNFLEEFNVPKMPSKRDIRKVMNLGFKKIRGTQRTDGAFGFWSLSSKVNIYLSIYVAHNLIRCKENGFIISSDDKTLLNRSKLFCQNVDQYINKYCDWYSEYSKASIQAFSLYVLSIYGLNKELSGHEMDQLSSKAEKLYKEKKKYFSHEGKVWLMFCIFICSREKEKHFIVLEVLKFINQNVNETPETANFITSYGDNDGKLVMLHSNRRTDGVILEVLCHVNPQNYLIPKIVKGLLAHKKKGRWNSTQENVYILMAIKKYFEVFENIVPDFLCRVWLGEGYAGEIKFKGREINYKSIDIPMKELVPNDNQEELKKKDLVLFKKGKGRMYYRLGMDYAPKSHDLKPVDYGFIVEREYEAVSEKENVKKLQNGVWKFKAGELIRVKLRLTNVSRRYHVALVDFIPAGCEVLNPELKGTEKVPGSAKSIRNHYSASPYIWCWWRAFYPWYEHVNLRDERVEAFSSYLYSGVHEYEYIMRATSFGEFVVPPAKAEEMYSPELFGRSASEKVIITE